MSSEILQSFEDHQQQQKTNFAVVLSKIATTKCDPTSLNYFTTDPCCVRTSSYRRISTSAHHRLFAKTKHATQDATPHNKILGCSIVAALNELSSVATCSHAVSQLPNKPYRQAVSQQVGRFVGISSSASSSHVYIFYCCCFFTVAVDGFTHRTLQPQQHHVRRITQNNLKKNVSIW